MLVGFAWRVSDARGRSLADVHGSDVRLGFVVERTSAAWPICAGFESKGQGSPRVEERRWLVLLA